MWRMDGKRGLKRNDSKMNKPSSSQCIQSKKGNETKPKSVVINMQNSRNDLECTFWRGREKEAKRQGNTFAMGAGVT